MDLNEIQSLIKFVSKTGVKEVELETKDFKISIKSESDKSKKNTRNESTVYQTIPQGFQVPQVGVSQPQIIPQSESDSKDKIELKKEDENLLVIKSPMIGTFYKSPSPDKPVFKSVGDNVAIGEIVCIVEAMKLFNEIESDVSGKIVKILVDDASPVEYDQPLFLVEAN